MSIKIDVDRSYNCDLNSLMVSLGHKTTKGVYQIYLMRILEALSLLERFRLTAVKHTPAASQEHTMRMEGTRNIEHMSTVLCQEAWGGRVPGRATLIRGWRP